MGQIFVLNWDYVSIKLWGYTLKILLWILKQQMLRDCTQIVKKATFKLLWLSVGSNVSMGVHTWKIVLLFVYIELLLPYFLSCMLKWNRTRDLQTCRPGVGSLPAGAWNDCSTPEQIHRLLFLFVQPGRRAVRPFIVLSDISVSLSEVWVFWKAGVPVHRALFPYAQRANSSPLGCSSLPLCRPVPGWQQIPGKDTRSCFAGPLWRQGPQRARRPGPAEGRPRWRGRGCSSLCPREPREGLSLPQSRFLFCFRVEKSPGKVRGN